MKPSPCCKDIRHTISKPLPTCDANLASSRVRRRRKVQEMGGTRIAGLEDTYIYIVIPLAQWRPFSNLRFGEGFPLKLNQAKNMPILCAMEIHSAFIWLQLNLSTIIQALDWQGRSWKRLS